MKRLSEEEVQKMPRKNAGKQSLARAHLMNMEIGDIILLERSEWKQRRKSPMELIRRMRKPTGRNYSCETLLDGSGWIIKRLK